MCPTCCSGSYHRFERAGWSWLKRRSVNRPEPLSLFSNVTAWSRSSVPPKVVKTSLSVRWCLWCYRASGHQVTFYGLQYLNDSSALLKTGAPHSIQPIQSSLFIHSIFVSLCWLKNGPLPFSIIVRLLVLLLNYSFLFTSCRLSAVLYLGCISEGDGLYPFMETREFVLCLFEREYLVMQIQNTHVSARHLL